MKLINITAWLMYFGFAKYLPASTSKINFGWSKFRAILAKGFVSHMGTNVNIEHGAVFSRELSIGDNSGVGINSVLQGKVLIGNNVMMGPEVFIYTRNHEHDRTDIAMIEQGFEATREVVIEDDVWIGSRVTILPGVVIGHGSIIGASATVAENIPPYSVAVGNPARIVKNRKQIR